MANITYKQYKDKRQAEFNALPIFFAFSNEQFKEQMEKRGLTENDTDKIYGLKGTGGFYLKKDADLIRAYFNKKDELPELMEDYEFAKSAFRYEMDNHEYAINWQGDWDVVSCFGNPKYSDTKDGIDYLKECGYGDTQFRAYVSARKEHMEYASEW